MVCCVGGERERVFPWQVDVSHSRLSMLVDGEDKLRRAKIDGWLAMWRDKAIQAGQANAEGNGGA